MYVFILCVGNNSGYFTQMRKLQMYKAVKNGRPMNKETADYFRSSRLFAFSLCRLGKGMLVFYEVFTSAIESASVTITQDDL
jgi:hypothetical protein